MGNLKANGIQIEYETFGNPSNPALLLIAGLSGQMLFWPSDFCSKIAENGYYVIRFDNRDTGLSTKIDGLDLEGIKEKIGELFMGKKTSTPYGLEHMADDCLGILDALNIHKAHIFGMSMGGHIAQVFCLKYTFRAHSLISLYSHTGNKSEFMPEQEVMAALFTPTPEEREANIKHNMDFFRLISGKNGTFDERFHKELLAASYDRCLCIEGTARQYLSMLTQKDRVSDLVKLNIPTLIIHGDKDPLVPLAGGEAIAGAVPNSKLIVIKGMGHDLPNLGSYGSEILDAAVNHLNNEFFFYDGQ